LVVVVLIITPSFWWGSCISSHPVFGGVRVDHHIQFLPITPKMGCDDLHESHQKLGVMIPTNPTKTECDDLHEPHQKLDVMIYTNPNKNWM
jgi:hypothetical protein